MHKFTTLVAVGALLMSVSAAFAAGTAPAQPTTPAPAAAPAPTPTASATAAKPMGGRHVAMHLNHVKAVQAALNSNGEQVTVDGRWGPKTHAAIEDFQQKNGLKVTGRADKETRQKLNVSM